MGNIFRYLGVILKDQSRPLVVDLVGTLIKTDVLDETLMIFIKLNIINVSTN